MEIIVPEPKPFDEKPKGPIDQAPATFGETAKSNFNKYIDPIIAQNQVFLSKGPYDPNAISRVEDFIEENGISGESAQYLRTFGIGSQENFLAANEFLEKRDRTRSILDRSTGLNLFASDPLVYASIVIPYAGFAATKSLGYLLARTSTNSASKIAAANKIKQAHSLMGPRKSLTAGNLAKITALDTAVLDGSLNLSKALTDLSFGEDVNTTLGNAALLTTATITVSSAFGYGLGKALIRPAASNKRVAVFHEGYKTYLNSITDKPIKRGEDLSYSGQWFNNSWFTKFLPSPVKVTVNDKLLPDWAVEDMLGLAGDNGMPLALHQLGRSIGTPVYTNAARRQGDWYVALNKINEDHRKLNSRGNAEFMNVPVGAFYEKIRSKLGMTSFAPDQWYNHVGRLMADDIPYEKMTPEEASSVQSARTFFEKYGKELEDEGLINARDIMEDTYLKTVGKQMELQSVVRSIIDANKKWMKSWEKKNLTKIKTTEAKLVPLIKASSSRGLTKKQIDFKKRLETELAQAKKDNATIAAKFELIRTAKNIDDLAALNKDLDLTPRMGGALQDIGKAMNETKLRIENALDVINKGGGKKSATNYLPRLFNRRKIHSDRDGFKKILMDHFKENPEVTLKGDDGLFKVKTFAIDPASLERRANETIETILGETDDDAIDAIFTGFGKSGPLVSRRLSINNSKVKDYIVTDIKELMIAYTNKVAPKIEYHKRFRNPKDGKLMTLEARIDYIRERMVKEKVPTRTINKYIKNFVHSYDRVVGTTLKRPDAIDTKVANFLRTATNWTFLGSSGVAAVGDAASLVMDHELRAVGSGLLGLMDDLSLKMSKHELNLAGEALEIVRGITHLKYMESLTNDVFTKSLPDKLNNAFYTLNGLAPITVTIKAMDGLLRGHTIIDASINLTKGQATPFEKTFLAQYNITPDLAKRISKTPYEKSQGNLFLPNTEAWVDDEAVIAFRNALNSGVMNRVIMGTPADKPITMDGVAYIPEAFARSLPFYKNLPKDSRVKGYVRIESGLLALPFTFYSYSFGALSKITGNHAAGAVRNRAAHMAVAMGLGYSIVKFRTPDWAWDEMDFDDKVMRSFDFSGLAAIHSDMAYRTLSFLAETGAANPENMPIKPKYIGEVDPFAAGISILGAPADWSYEVISGVKEMLGGDVGTGAQTIARMLPLTKTLLLGDGLKQGAIDLAGQLPNKP